MDCGIFSVPIMAASHKWAEKPHTDRSAYAHRVTNVKIMIKIIKIHTSQSCQLCKNINTYVH